MKKILIALILCLTVGKFHAQEAEQRVITTAVPFLLIAADARSAGIADMGVATSSDVFSQQWNPAKYAFALSKQAIGVTYTPYLSQLVNDIFLGQISYYNRINERSGIGASFRYFSNGDIELRESAGQEPLIVRPNEFALDLSYSLRLSDRFSMAIAGRFINSNLKFDQINDASAASTFAVDIAGYYQSEEIAYNSFDGRWRAGFNISNIGPKLSYSDDAPESNIPTNLSIGGGFDFILDEYNRIGVMAEFNKLLVPTPQDFNGDGVIDQEDAQEYADIGFFEGIFKSFGDAPDGLSEELKEITWALGAEYWYQDAFAFRMGYFHESEDKGFRQFFSLGAGFKYTSLAFDVSYLFSTSRSISPLEGTLRFGLTFNFGDTYDEY